MIHSFTLYFDKANVLRMQPGHLPMPDGARLVYSENVCGSSCFSGIWAETGPTDSTFAQAIIAARREMARVDPRWRKPELEGHMQAGTLFWTQGLIDHAIAAYEAAIKLAESCDEYGLMIAAYRQCYACLSSKGAFLAASRYMEKAMQTAEERFPDCEHLQSVIRHEWQVAEANAIAPEVFSLLAETYRLTDQSEFQQAEEKCLLALQTALEKFTRSHWLVATCMRDLSSFRDDAEALQLLEWADKIASDWGPPGCPLRTSISNALHGLEQ